MARSSTHTGKRLEDLRDKVIASCELDGELAVAQLRALADSSDLSAERWLVSTVLREAGVEALLEENRRLERVAIEHGACLCTWDLNDAGDDEIVRPHSSCPVHARAALSNEEVTD